MLGSFTACYATCLDITTTTLYMKRIVRQEFSNITVTHGVCNLLRAGSHSSFYNYTHILVLTAVISKSYLRPLLITETGLTLLQLLKSTPRAVFCLDQFPHSVSFALSTTSNPRYSKTLFTSPVQALLGFFPFLFVPQSFITLALPPFHTIASLYVAILF